MTRIVLFMYVFLQAQVDIVKCVHWHSVPFLSPGF